MIKIKKIICLLLYYCFAQHLPESASRFGGASKKLRYILCKNIFKKCGKNVNINRHAKFGNGWPKGDCPWRTDAAA